MIKRILLFSALLLTGISFSQESTLKEGWNYFINNDFSSAKEKLFDASKNEETKTDAHLALSIVYQMESDIEKAFFHFKEFYRVSKNPTNELYALWKTESVSNGRGKLSPDRFSFINTLMFNGKDGMYQTINNEFLNNHYLRSNKIAQAREFGKRMGGIDKWQVLGTFDNISASGFNKDYEAIKYAKSDRQFRNKNGGKINWFKVTNVNIDKWLVLSNHFINSNSIIYSQTFCNSQTEQEVQVRIGAVGSFKLWVNDNLVLEQEEEQVNDIDAYGVTVKLNKGYNRILVQSGCSEINESGLFVRLTDQGGINLTNLTYDNEYHEYTKATDNKIKELSNPVEDYYKAKIEANPGIILNYILLAHTYNHNDKTQEQLKILKEAEIKFPTSSYLKALLVAVYSDLNNETDVSKELEALKELAPESYLALALFAQEEIEKEDYDKAEEYNNKIIQKYDHDLLTTSIQIQLASNREQIEKLRTLVKTVYKQYPENSDIVYLKYIILKKLDNNTYGAINLLKKYSKKNFDYKALSTLANDYFETGNVTKGIAVYTKLAKDFPEETNYLATLGQIYFSMQQYEKATDYYKSCLEVAPYATGYFEKIAQTYEERGYTNQAIEYYNKVIEYGKYDFEAREKVRQLNGQAKLYESFETVPDAEELFSQSPKAEEYPEDNSILLLNEVQRIVHKDGASEEKHYEMIKVFNASGVDSWKEYSVGSSNNQRLVIEEAKVFKKDGTKLDGEINYSYVVFTDLEEGDAVYVVYKLETFNYGKLAKHFWDKHYFEYFMPSGRNRYNLLIHNSKEFKHEVTNGKVEPTITEKEGYTLYEWKSEKKPALRSESYMPNLVDIGTTLHLSSFKDWNEITNWYIDLSQTKQKSDVELKETVTALFEGKDSLSEMEKVKLIYNYITENIRYSSVSFRQSGLIPQKASKVITTKLGDCKDVSTLFVSMCNEIGINANLVLINTRDEGDNDVYLPSIDFNHCIAQVAVNDQKYYVELTSDLIPFSTFGYTLKKSTALEIVAGNNELKKLDAPTRVKNEVKRYTKITFNDDDMTVSKSNEKSGVFSGYVRSNYRDIGKEQQKKDMQKAVSGMYVKTKLSSVTFDESLDENRNTVDYKYEYVVEDVFNDVGGILIFKLPWAESEEQPSFIATETRKFPINIWEYSIADLELEKITIDLPTDKKLVKEKPSDIVYDNEFFSYKLVHSRKGNTLEITREFRFKKDQISPEDYITFKEAYEKVIKADSRQLAFNELQ